MKLVHYRYAEFANATGPHGGETIISENGDIVQLTPAYQVSPSINTIIGVTRGAGGTIGTGATAFGRDLSADAMVAGGTQLAANDEAFELFDHGNGTACNNCIDLIGFGFLQGGRKLLKIPGMGFLLTL